MCQFTPWRWCNEHSTFPLGLTSKNLGLPWEKPDTCPRRILLQDTQNSQGHQNQGELPRRSPGWHGVAMCYPGGTLEQKRHLIKTKEIWIKIPENSLYYLFQFSIHLKFLITTTKFLSTGETEAGWQWVWDQPELHNMALFQNPRSGDTFQRWSTCLWKAQLIYL